MKKIRRVLQAMLFITFLVGIHNGMKAGNLAVILINGIIVLVLIIREKKER